MEWTQLTGKTLHGSFIFDWWWRSHQLLAHKDLRIFRFCIMSWKDERESIIKYDMGRQVDVIQKFSRVQSFGQNYWWAYGIRVALLPRIHHTAACPWSSRSRVEPENFTGRIIFMSMFNDISWGSKDNENECESSAQLVSVYTKRFSRAQWSFLGLGSEKKWYSTYIDRPRGEWDRVAELMMIQFRESGIEDYWLKTCRSPLKLK